LVRFHVPNAVRRLCWALALLLTPWCAGCHSGTATYPVTGSIRFAGGDPVPFGVVEFRDEQSRRTARGTLNPSGEFTLGTFAASDGAPPGQYQVIVVQHFAMPPIVKDARGSDAMTHEHEAGADIRVAPEYADYATSPLRAEVKPQSTNEFEFIVNRYRKRP
jgi:hypothetical protein